MSLPNLKIGYVVDPICQLNFAKDSTVALMHEAQQRGFENYAITLPDLFSENGSARARMDRVYVEETSYRSTDVGVRGLEEMDLVLMRKDPPVDLAYSMALDVLNRVNEQKTLVLNRPASLQQLNEKTLVCQFPEWAPDILLTASVAHIRSFLQSHESAVIKPTNLMGGRSIYLLRRTDPNLSVILEDMTRRQRRYVVVQEYLPEIVRGGDERLLFINGKMVPYGIARIPAPGDHRGNLARGATARGFSPQAHHRAIERSLGPFFRKWGLFFVGIDIIGGKLTEINITSPTGISEIRKLSGIDAAALFFDTLLKSSFNN